MAGKGTGVFPEKRTPGPVCEKSQVYLIYFVSRNLAQVKFILHAVSRRNRSSQVFIKPLLKKKKKKNQDNTFSEQVCTQLETYRLMVPVNS